MSKLWSIINMIIKRSLFGFSLSQSCPEQEAWLVIPHLPHSPPLLATLRRGQQVEYKLDLIRTIIHSFHISYFSTLMFLSIFLTSPHWCSFPSVLMKRVQCLKYSTLFMYTLSYFLGKRTSLVCMGLSSVMGHPLPISSLFFSPE